MSSDRLVVEHLSAEWAGVPVLHDISFTVSEGELLTLFGPNGSGKTTLLRAIAGLESPAGGRILLDSRSLDGVPTHRRGIGLLAQDPVLFPGRDVFNNIAYGLFVAGQSDGQVRSRVSELVSLLHLEGLENRHAEELSGGQRQRVALARALAPRPTLLLLDEPFASLDAQIRAELRAELRPLLRRNGTTAIHVTHDLEEGLFVGDRVALLFEGRLLQVGEPLAVFTGPRSAHAARIMGYNLIPTPEGLVAAQSGEIELVPVDASGLTGLVEDSGFAGAGHLCHLRLPAGDLVEVRRVELPHFVEPGRRVGLKLLRPMLLPRAPPDD